MKTNFLPLKFKMEENKNEKNYKKKKIIHYKNLSSDDFCEPFYYNENEFNDEKKLMRSGTLSNKSIYKNNLPKKKRLFNFVEVENKNKNLKVYDGKKFKSYLNRNNNVIYNYYDNRKFSSIIFHRLHRISLQNNNCKKSIVNNLYFCTKINNKKRKKKSKKSKKNLKTERETENNNIKNFYMNRLSSNSINIQEIKQEKYYSNKIQNNTINDFNNYKNNFKSNYAFHNSINNNSNSISKNQTSERSQNQNKTLYPKFSNGNITEFKIGKDISSNNPNSFPNRAKYNYTFYEMAERRNIFNPNKIRLEKTESKKQEKKENIKIPIININIGDKFMDLFLPKIKYNNNMNNQYSGKNIKSNSFLNSSNSINQKNKTFYYTNRNNHKIRTIKNKNPFKIKNPERISKNLSSFNIMNYNNKESSILNNHNTTGIHYFNDSLCSICHPSTNNHIDKLNTTQRTKSSSFGKNNSPFDSHIINQCENKDETRKNNTKKNLENRKEYSRYIHKRFFDSLKKKNKDINIKKEIKQKMDEIILRKYEKKFVSINEYFK